MATQATTPRHDTTTDATFASEEVPAQGHDRLPDGWRHSALVSWLREQSRERRETALAGLFGLVGALWAPLGILSFLAGVFMIFLVVSALVVVAVAAPRPAAVAHVRQAVDDHVVPSARAAGRELAVAFRHVRRELPAELATLWDRAAPGVRRAGSRVRTSAAGILASLRRGGAHVRARLAELGPGPAQSRPRSAR